MSENSPILPSFELEEIQNLANDLHPWLVIETGHANPGHVAWCLARSSASMEKDGYFLLSNADRELSGRLFGGASDTPSLRRSIVAGHSATLQGWSGPGAHLAGVNLQFATRTDEFGFDRVAAGQVDQFHRDACASSHPTIAPLGHRGDQGIEIKPFFREPILEATRVLFVDDASKNPIMHQLTQTVRQPMRRQLQILLNGVEPPDAEEYIADD